MISAGQIRLEARPPRVEWLEDQRGRIPVDNMPLLRAYFRCSDSTLSKRICSLNLNLGAANQPSSDCLNTFQARAYAWDGPCGILPGQLNGSPGPISCLNRKRLTPYGAGPQRACLRSMLLLAARLCSPSRIPEKWSTLSPVEQKINERGLYVGAVVSSAWSEHGRTEVVGSNPILEHQHTDPSGFSSSFHSKGNNSHMRRSGQPYLFLGGIPLFSAFLPLFNPRSL